MIHYTYILHIHYTYILHDRLYACIFHIHYTYILHIHYTYILHDTLYACIFHNKIESPAIKKNSLEAEPNSELDIHDLEVLQNL